MSYCRSVPSRCRCASFTQYRLTAWNSSSKSLGRCGNQSHGSGIHHLGFWSDDVAGDGTELKAQGYCEEASGLDDDSNVLWSFHRNDEGGARIELVPGVWRP